MTPPVLATIELSRAGSRTAPSPAATGSASLRFRIVHLLRGALILLIVANLGYLPVLAAGRKEAPLFLNDLLIGALLFAALVAILRTRRFVVDPPAVAALAFALVGGLSTVLAIPRFDLTGFQFVFSIAYLLRWLAYFGIYLVVINFLRRSDVPVVWRTLERVILVFAGFGILQSILFPGFAQMVHSGSEVGVDWDAQGRRLVSTFLDPNFAGAFIMTGLLVLLARLSFGDRVPYWKLLLLLAALVLTLSRSSVLGLIAGGLVIASVRGLATRFVRFSGTAVLVALLAAPLVIGFAASFNRFSLDGSALTRIVAWLNALRVLADHPVIGVGFNTFGFVQEQYGYRMIGRASFALDGGLLFIAVMTGLVGVTLYVTMVLLVLRRCRNCWRQTWREPEARGISLGVAAVTVGMLVHSVFLNSLLFPFLMQTLWVLWGLSAVIASSGRDAAPQIGAEPAAPASVHGRLSA